ncbi:MAG: HipA domain-containing protein [Defluviitaleaceae bacterium]|nr:HipA domain-containing protein [Defluviitaleaceae bacterium]
MEEKNHTLECSIHAYAVRINFNCDNCNQHIHDASEMPTPYLQTEKTTHSSTINVENDLINCEHCKQSYGVELTKSISAATVEIFDLEDENNSLRITVFDDRAPTHCLMHQKIPIIDVKISELTGEILDTYHVYNFKHLPISVKVNDGVVDKKDLHEWFSGRRIPASREQINDVLQHLDISRTGMLVEKCFGLSLSDHYWIKPRNSNLDWEKINFFDNDFSEEIGNLLIGESSAEMIEIDLKSPDNTSDGVLRKRWKVINGKRCLIKAGSDPYKQETYNEVIASRMMELLGIEHTPYWLMLEKDEPYSVCEIFITKDTEHISAWAIKNTLPKKDKQTSEFNHFLTCCEALGIPNARTSIEQMLVIDYLIVNDDRHTNNFGAIRNVHTLKWLGITPIYDNGSSFWNKKILSDINSRRGLKSKPFLSSHDSQIKLVSSFEWLELDKLKHIDEEIRSVFSHSKFISKERCEKIILGVKQRIDELTEMIERSHIHE